MRSVYRLLFCAWVGGAFANAMCMLLVGGQWLAAVPFACITALMAIGVWWSLRDLSGREQHAAWMRQLCARALGRRERSGKPSRN